MNPVMVIVKSEEIRDPKKRAERNLAYEVEDLRKDNEFFRKLNANCVREILSLKSSLMRWRAAFAGAVLIAAAIISGLIRGTVR